MTMMGAQFFLTARFGRASAPFGIDIIYYLHRLTAILGFGLVLAHASILFAAKPGLFGRMYSTNMPWHAVAANAALLGFVVLIVTSLWRKTLRIPYERWRRWHGDLAVAGLLFALIHVELAGYYVQVPWKRVLWTVITLSWLALLVYVRLVKPLLMLRKPYTVIGVRQERGNSWTLRVEPEGHRGLRYLPGQFAWLTVGRSPFSLNEHPFSMSSSAAEPGRLEFTVKEVGDFTRTVKDIPPGTRAYIDGPFGAFTADCFPKAAGNVFFAGGVGIAPIMGKEVYDEQACSLCHPIAGEGDPRYPLDGIGARRSAEFIRTYIAPTEEIRSSFPGETYSMKQPYHELPEDEMNAPVDYLRSVR